jgi:hypothetical protein
MQQCRNGDHSVVVRTSERDEHGEPGSNDNVGSHGDFSHLFDRRDGQVKFWEKGRP